MPSGTAGTERSLGYAVYGENMNLTDFVKVADTNLYKSKTENKNGFLN